MTLTDWIGFIGVAILVAAYFLNLINVIQKESYAYLWQIPAELPLHVSLPTCCITGLLSC